VTVWDACRGAEHLGELTLEAFRAVESQHVTSTRKLVDSDDEQRLLEELIETVKPAVPSTPEFRGLHYLLFTPFRYPPLRWGSRFGTRGERGIWYGSGDLETCFAEVSYYRILFLEGTAADMGSLTMELTAFTASIAATRGVDLTRMPFREHEHLISSKTTYTTSHELGRIMRGEGVDAFLFTSARRAAPGINVGLFEPVFSAKKPRKYQTWTCTASRDKVELSHKNLAHPRGPKRVGDFFLFQRSIFEVDGAFPVCSS